MADQKLWSAWAVLGLYGMLEFKWNFIATEHGRRGSMEDCGVSNAEYLVHLDSVSQDQFSWDQLATRSTLTGSTCHEINSHGIKINSIFLCLFYWTKASWGKHHKVLIMLECFWSWTSLPQISIVVPMFLINKSLPAYIGRHHQRWNLSSLNWAAEHLLERREGQMDLSTVWAI